MSERPTDQPLVSICVPTFNRAKALRQGLADIRRQTYTPLEIVISDNASTDDTEAVCRQAAAEDARIRYMRQSRNLGLYGNHNACIEASRGPLLGFFHDHDERDPELVSEFVRFLQRHPEVGIVSSDWELIDEAGHSLGARDHQVKAVMPGLEYIEHTLKSGRSSIGVPGALFRREALGDIRFDAQGPVGFGDFVVWCRVAERWHIGHMPRRLWRWRQHRQSQSARTIESLTRDYDESMNAYCDGHLARHPQHTRLVGRWRALIRRYLFWVLAYEVGLHFRPETSRAVRSGGSPTLFEILGYRLSDQEFARVLQQMRRYRTGLWQFIVWAGITAMVALGMTRPLAWATQHQASLRRVLRLK